MMKAEHYKTPEEVAAQIWCEERHSHLKFDAELAKSVAAVIADEQRYTDSWCDLAAYFYRNECYCRDLLDQIGQEIGPLAYIADDGSIHDTVLRAKLPELVNALLFRINHLDQSAETWRNLYYQAIGLRRNK